MPYFVYILECADGSYYTGHTDLLGRRIAEHQSGALPGFTHSRRPVRLRWSEQFATREEALAAEQRIKGWSRAKKMALIDGDWAAIARLARRVRPFETKAQAGPSPCPQGEREEERDSRRVTVCPEEGTKPQAEDPSRRIIAPMQPAIILVRPQLGENIGKAARAMLNFGLTDMRIVAPRDGWPNPSAGPAAAGADAVLDRARIYDSTAAAVADCRHVYATTVRKRGVHKAVLTPEAAMREAVGFDYPIGILFGPERSGLASEDVDLARTIVTVPVNPDFGSLNLAQAVLLVAYEWSRAQTQPLAMPTLGDHSAAPATQAELDGLVAHLESALEGTRFFYPEDRLEATKRTLRSVLTRPGWNAEEVQILRGVIASLVKKRRQ